MMYPISKAEYDRALAQNTYYKDRWPYYEEAIGLAMKFNPKACWNLAP